ncbi:MAG: DUF4442 domain-containing protein [Microbacterium sp.]|nr:DUF4442 domain-containing protein [Microbacterium sp.]
MSHQDNRFRKRSAARLRRLMNWWPPLLFAGVRIVEWAPDYTAVTVRSAKPNGLTANAYGTQFGGTLYSMTDPFYSILVNEQLDRGYNVWDQRGEIDYVSPGRGPVTARIEVAPEVVAEIRAAAEGGEKVLRWFECEVIAADGTLVAKVRKQLYIRKKRPKD